MYITSLSLQSFRNYESGRIDFSPGTNIIMGDNAQGKTNILEAVYLFSHGRSHRAKQDSELIRFDSAHAKLEASFTTRERSFTAQMLLSGSGKSIKINNVPILRLSKLMNYLNVVLFSPEDLSLIKGSPSVRRRFMDAAISQLYPNYMLSLSGYHKALVQKNSLLKSLKKSGSHSDPALTAWNTCLSDDGEKIIKYRRDFIRELNSFAGIIQNEISAEELLIEYEPNTDGNLLEYLEAHQQREIDYASSLFGIQRDDIKITVGGRDTRMFCSQGQQRTAALSLKIAQADYIHHIKDEYPVLLLDDIMSELDKGRRRYLWEKIKNKQALITCTDADDFAPSDNIKRFCVRQGTVTEE